MSTIRKQQICALLKGIETGDPASVEVVNQAKYIQHNPETQEGSIGLAELFKRLSKSNPSVNIVRVFADGNYVFAHTEYDFGSPKVGFEIFRFEDDQAVEHWDNIQPRQGPNPSKHSMVDGTTDVIDLQKTEANRDTVKAFVEDILINRQLELLTQYINSDFFTLHNSFIADGLSAYRSALESTSSNVFNITYDQNHRLLADGNFVLSVSEGSIDGVHSSFYDLFRIDEGKIIEHWDTIEAIPPRSNWKNENGKF